MSGFVRLSPVLERAGDKVFFECPGCRMLHGLNVESDGCPRWTWNGDVDRPTFQPSILVRYEWGQQRTEMTCHSFVTDGRIQFLDDCTHALAGQTVDLPELES
ncbi:DUF6527 family protein [Pseudomonas sp. PDM13]|uniref:DUF6527 family protein n=1 Tax=Pseudomonas sp. PDM13 TaxID=2769255 RepID=UPI0021DFB67C|nr:DUF6527 family protein [Pseudomonas sp. PDM13]MCU9947484.1 DUF6527 family protein [Pseudomonas sp. PDM13]